MQDQSTPIRRSFRAQLKKLRNKSGLTQREAAIRLKLKRTTYEAYETGRCMPPNEMLIAMSQLWGISIEELVKGENAFVVDAKNFS